MRKFEKGKKNPHNSKILTVGMINVLQSNIIKFIFNLIFL